jgi:hypothetical protein
MSDQDMSDQDKAHGLVRPRTAVLTLGFDPRLSVGSARPAVFRSSTYVFASPEEAEQAFDIITGKVQPENAGRADLIYSRFSHPNAEILEDQIVPLESGATDAAVFNSGMAAIMTAFFTFARPASQIVYTVPLLRRDGADPHVSRTVRRADSRVAGQTDIDEASERLIRHRAGGDACQLTMTMTDIVAPPKPRPGIRPNLWWDNIAGAGVPASDSTGRRHCPVLGDEISVRF